MSKFFKLLNIEPEVEMVDPDHFRERLHALLMSGDLAQEDVRQAKHMLPKDDISDLIEAHADDNCVELGCLIAAYPSFRRWQENPMRARVEWLVDLYIASEWIGADEKETLLSLSPVEALEKLHAVCLQRTHLRSKGKEVVHIRLTDEMRQRRETLRDLLKAAGIENDHLLWRYVRPSDIKATNRERLKRFGNDRDDMSQLAHNHLGGWDGESLAMIRCGVGAGQTTYADKLYDGVLTEELDLERTYLVYANNALTMMGANGVRRHQLSNGFRIFHFDGEIMERSLLVTINNYHLE